MRHLFSSLTFVLAASTALAQDCQQHVQASDHGSLPGAEFGGAVDVHGDLALVGAIDDSQGAPGAGAVYAYRFLQGAWVETQKILAPVPRPDAHFGWSVALHGEQAAVGAAGGAGQAFALAFDAGTGQWTIVQELLRNDGGFQEAFGASVAIADGVIIAGHIGDDDIAPYAGSAYVFAWEANTGTWNHETELFAPILPPEAGPGAGASADDQFGSTVIFDGHRAVISAPFDNGMWGGAGGIRRGAAEIFERDAISGTWIYDEHMRPCELRDDDALGLGSFAGAPLLAIDGERCAISTRRGGIVFIFERSPASDTWRKTQVIRDPMQTIGTLESSGFGTSLAFIGGALWVGVPSDDYAGAVLVYRESLASGDFEVTEVLHSDNPQAGDYFGASIALDGIHGLVGTPMRDAANGGLEVFDARCHFELGMQSCAGTANSTGAPGRLRVLGDPDPSGGFVRLTADSLPPNQFGYFIASSSAVHVPNPGGSQGVLCLGLPAGRWNAQVASSGPDGTLELFFDPQQMPAPLGAIQAGDVQYFQAWHRDGQTSNFTSAVGVTFQ